MHTHPISLCTRFIVGKNTCTFGHFQANDDQSLIAVTSDSNWFNIAIISLVNFPSLVLRGISISFPVLLYFFIKLKRLCKLIEMFSLLKRFLISATEYPDCFKMITSLLVAISNHGTI